MPLLTVKEVSEKCCKEPKALHVYIKRGKLVKRADNLIDTTNPTNRIFFDRYGVKNEHQPEQVIAQPPQQEPKKEKKTRSKSESKGEFVTAFEMERLKAEKLEQEILQLRLKNQRLEGELIDLELVKQTMFEVINAYRTTNYIAAENVLKTNMKDLDVDNDKLTKAIADLSALFNTASTQAIDNVKMTFEKIIGANDK